METKELTAKQKFEIEGIIKNHIIALNIDFSDWVS